MFEWLLTVINIIIGGYHVPRGAEGAEEDDDGTSSYYPHAVSNCRFYDPITDCWYRPLTCCQSHLYT
jgi:hypothetical protein